MSEVEHPKALLQRHGLEARKSLGQNFLVPGPFAERIVRIAGVKRGETVVEIGPGLGALTGALVDAGARVVAVDLDEAMVRVLRETFAGNDAVEIVHGDARELELAPIAARAEGGKVRVVGNLPYYASSPLMRRTIEQRAYARTATFTLQREVADRIAAPPGSKTYGALSVIVGLHADATVPARLPPGAFHPRPGVESAVLHLVFRERPRAEVADERLFEKVVFSAFGHRRKTIQNSMRDSTELPLEPGAIAKALSAAGIDPQRRAETVSVEEFARLANAVGDR